MAMIDTDPTARHQAGLRASLLAFGAGVVWSLGAAAARAADQSDVWQYLLWRSVGIILVMETVSIVRRHRSGLAKSGLASAFTSGWSMIGACLSLLTASLAFVDAIKTTTAANAAFLASVTPLVAAVLARVFLGERLTRLTVIAIALALTGLGIMVFSDLEVGSMSGNIAAVVSSVGFASYTVFVRTDLSRDWSPVLPGYALMMILITMAVTMANGRTLVPPATDIALAMTHGAVLIVAGTLMFNVASRSIPAVAMTVLAQSETVFVPFWIFLAFGERPGPRTLFGAGLVLTAVIGKAVLDDRFGAVRPHRDVPGAFD